MNIDEHVEATLNFFDSDAGILSEILFVGAWARYFYRDLFKNLKTYQARMLTKDLDVLLHIKKKREKQKVDVHQRLIQAGYHAEFYPSNVIKYFRDDLELEFLIPTRGAPHDKAVQVEAYNVTAQELSYLEMLWDRPQSVRYGKYHLYVPHPLDFAIHKLIISFRRKKPASGEQDRRDAEEVLYALSHERDFDDIFQQTLLAIRKNRKTFKAVENGIATFILPSLRERLQKVP